MNKYDYYTVSIRNRKIIVSGQYVDRITKTNQQLEKLRELSKKKYSGEIKEAGRRLIENRFHCWYRVIVHDNHMNEISLINEKDRFVMITLTLPAPQIHTDEWLKLKALKPFIKKLEKERGCTNWAWKAEAQRNGNIHFHIVIDRYVPKTWIDKTWYHYMSKLEYIDRYLAATGKRIAPMCNVKGQKEMKNPVAYMTKYFEKNENRRKISGAIWRMSKNLLLLENFKLDVSSSEVAEIFESVKKKIRREFEDDFFKLAICKKEITFADLKLEWGIDEELHWEMMSQRLKHGTIPDDGTEASRIARKEIRQATGLPVFLADNDYQQLCIPGFDAMELPLYRRL